MPVETGELLINNSHENNPSCEVDTRIKFDELGLSLPFEVTTSSAVVLRNFTENFLVSETVKVDMVYGSGLGTDFTPLIMSAIVVALQLDTVRVLVLPGRYRLRYVGSRDPSELIIQFNSYPNTNIDYTQLALA